MAAWTWRCCRSLASRCCFRTRRRTANSWVGLQLRGTRSNRDAIGASVQISSCGKTQFETVRNGGSYLSRNDPRLHFGLGACAKVDRVTVTWPQRDGAKGEAESR